MSTQFTHRTLHYFRFHPGHFVLLQLPLVIPEIIDRVFLSHAPDVPLLQQAPKLALYFVVSAVISFWSVAATYVSVRTLVHHRKLSFFETVKSTNAKLPQLIPAALLFASVEIVGLLALFIPGIIIATRYCFLPQLIIDEEAPSLMVYFNRSHRLAKTRFLQTLGVVIGINSISLALYPVFQLMEQWLTKTFLSVAAPEALWLAVGLAASLPFLLSITASAVLDVWMAGYYLNLKEKGTE